MNEISRRQMLGLLPGGAVAALVASPVVASAGVGCSDAVFNVKCFGAVGDGVVDDTVAILDALGALETHGKGVLYFPAGSYLLTSSISTANISFAIKGDGIELSMLVCRNCNGVEIDNSGWLGAFKPSVNVEGMTFCADSVGAYTAFDYVGPNNSALGKQLGFRDCQFRGQTTAKGWQIGVDLRLGGMSDFLGCYFLGSSADIDCMVYGVRLREVSTDVKIVSCFFYWMAIGVYLVGESGGTGTDAGEGLVVQSTNFAPVRYGIWSRYNTGNFIVLSANHIAAYTRGIVLGTPGVVGSNLSYVTNNLIFNEFGSQSDFVGIEVHANRSAIMGNEVMFANNGQMSRIGIVLAGTATYNRLIANNVFDQGTGIWLQAGTLKNVVSGNIGANNGVFILNSGTGNVLSDNIG